tara:strand:+ start:385 stop:642 length:258 start_codon:yes stop_codon:yes gene_type:complete
MFYVLETHVEWIILFHLNNVLSLFFVTSLHFPGSVLDDGIASYYFIDWHGYLLKAPPPREGEDRAAVGEYQEAAPERSSRMYSVL